MISSRNPMTYPSGSISRLVASPFPGLFRRLLWAARTPVTESRALVYSWDVPTRTRATKDSALTGETSVLSLIKCRIEPFEFHAGVVDGELPVDLSLDPVS